MKLSVRYQTNDMSPHLCLFRRKDLQNWLMSFWSPTGCTRTITRWIQNFTPKSHWSAWRQQVYIYLQYRLWWTGTKFNSLGGRWSTETWRWSWRKEEVDMYQIRGQRGALAVDSDSPECWTLWYYLLRDYPKEESSCADFLDIAIFKQCVSETICTSLSNMWFFRCDSMCEMKIQPKMPLVQIRNMDLTANRGLTLVLVLVQIRFWRTNMHLYLLCPPFWLSEKLSIEAALSTNYSTVWYGIYMVFYGMVWYGMAWHGIVWHQIIQWESQQPLSATLSKSTSLFTKCTVVRSNSTLCEKSWSSPKFINLSHPSLNKWANI